jgi:hypothetical protein
MTLNPLQLFTLGAVLRSGGSVLVVARIEAEKKRAFDDLHVLLSCDGFKLSTSNPSTILVKNGLEVHVVDADKAFRDGVIEESFGLVLFV